MKRNLALLAGAAAGAVALVGALRRRARSEPGAQPSASADPRAQELRRKLAAARDAAAEEDAFAEPAVGEDAMPEERPTRADNPVASADADIDEARRRIHEQGRSAAADMRRSGEEPEGS